MKISLRTQHQNLGDLLINSAALEIASKDNTITLDTRRVPQKYLALISKFYNPTPQARNRKILLLKPGGYGGITTYSVAAKRLAHSIYLFLHKIFGYRIIRLPSSQGLSKKPFQIIENIRTRCTDVLLIRDYFSLQTALHNQKKATYCPDLSLIFFDQETIFTNIYSAKTERPHIAISFRGDRCTSASEKLHMVNKIVQKLEIRMRKIKVVSQVTYDDDFNQELANKTNDEITKYDLSEHSVSQIRDVYTTSKYIISDRLHALLLGCINGAIPIALIDKNLDKKVDSCMRSLGIKNIIYTNNIDYNTSQIENNIEEIRTKIENQKKLLMTKLELLSY